MANLAEWANIDAFILNEISLEEVVMMLLLPKKNLPFFTVVFLKEFMKIDFNPNFKDELILFISIKNKIREREFLITVQANFNGINQ
jgi:hypothetical protein